MEADDDKTSFGARRRREAGETDIGTFGSAISGIVGLRSRACQRNGTGKAASARAHRSPHHRSLYCQRPRLWQMAPQGVTPLLLRIHLRSALRPRSEEHTSELQSLMRNSYAVFCLNKTKRN